DFKSASASTDAIVYEQFGSLGLFDLRSGKTQTINVTVEADFPGIRPRFEKVGSQISNAAISPTGARAVFEARGEIITVPAEKGDPRNLTNSPGVMERDPSWSPDGKWIAYFSEASGEYALHLSDQKGGEVKRFPLGANPSFYYSPTWSPDSQKIAFYDTANTLWYLQLDKGTLTKVDTNPFGLRDNVVIPNWSPDSRWIAYVKQLPNLLRAVFIYSLEDNKFRQVTDGMSDARHVNFDKSGKYLYFSASTNIGPSLSFADLSGIAHQVTRSLYLVVLRSDLPSPLAPESSDENDPEAKSDKKPNGDGPKPDGPSGPGAEKKPVEPVRIDFDGIEQRILALPLPTSNYADLVAGKANTLFVLEAPPPGPGAFGLIVHKFDLEKRKTERLLANVGSFAVSANGEKMLYQTGPQWMIAPTGMPGGGGRPGDGPGKPGEGSLNVAAMEVRVEPRAEWKQMFYEIWRHERDFFYDPNLHGLNVEKVVKTYEPFLASVNHRTDLNYLFIEMLNQLTVGHMFISGGDVPDVKRVPGGLLGADYTIDQNRYRFAKVYNGENWNPQVKAPLTQPGVNVKAGEYLLAVNGRDLTARENVYAAFESMAGKSVLIKVGPTPDGVGAREVTVVPVGSEAPLRNLAWIEGNRRKVEQLSGGKLGYVYIPDTGFGGYNSFNRYFFSQTNKDGAVIDERFNGGGLLADYIVSYLSRPQLNFIRYRHGADVNVPAGAIYGPKVLLINELAGSGGDALPWYFRKMNVGQMISKRTWGGLIAAFGAPTLMDGGRVTAPDAALYGLKGEWEVENAGVAPDIEVEFDPAAWRQGRDPQLEKGVEVLLEDLKKNPRPQYPQPKYPNYHQN
ncbi:MAG TPA: PDZ domain-containing protein, partial [Acidobacteriota bacterium]|nr:PDZ domain-containing protein [Acidobacteriota bacterium]